MTPRLPVFRRLIGGGRVRTGGLRPAQPDWRATIRQRTVVAVCVLALWGVAIEARLVYLQVVARGSLVKLAEMQSQRKRPLPAIRGDIVARDGQVLATSADGDAIGADPSDVADKAAVVEQVCAALRNCSTREKREMLERMNTGRQFAYLRRQATPDEALRVKELKIKGVRIEKESRRWYPKKELAAHVLGFVGRDNNGLAGIEFAYDDRILGESGQVVVVKDGKGNTFDRVERAPTVGGKVELTIDMYLQHVAERELRAAMREYRPEGGSVVIMRPRTGEILAMANEPPFNPNAFSTVPPSQRRNRAVQDTYEPGSTFKIVTASAAIEEKVLPVTAMIDTNPGTIRIGDRVVREYHGHNYHVLSFEDVIVKSSNVGAIKVGFKIGDERLIRYVERFGFGRKTSIDFLGENPGLVTRSGRLSDGDLASVSMGYGVAVTPLQIVAAFSAIANGGEYIEPRIVRAITEDGRRGVVPPRLVRRSVSQETAAVLTTLMEGVVERGTAKLAQIPGYTIAGKTGTAEKLINGRYSSSLHHVSFAGFIPSRQPEIAMIVLLDAPRAGGNSGGAAAAPVFKRIAAAAMQHLKIGPTINPDPPVLVARHEPVITVPTAANLATEPAPATVAVDTPPGTFPDLSGLSLRDATHRLAKLGLTPSVRGDGFVVSQQPAPGAPLEAGMRCRIVLDRLSPRGGTGGAQR